MMRGKRIVVQIRAAYGRLQQLGQLQLLRRELAHLRNRVVRLKRQPDVAAAYLDVIAVHAAVDDAARVLRDERAVGEDRALRP